MGPALKRAARISNMLDREGGPTVEDLLADDDILNEVKTGNQRLNEYLCTKQNLSKLIEFITLTPRDPNNKQLTYR